jgi:hypothetical protein
MAHLIGPAIGLFIVAGALFGLIVGRTPERLAAAVVVLDELLGITALQLFPESKAMIFLAGDGLSALALLAVTIRYGSPWMGGMMLFFASQFALHSYYLVTERPDDYLHAVINNVNWSAITWCLIIGTAVAWRRRSALARPAQQAAP